MATARKYWLLFGTVRNNLRVKRVSGGFEAGLDPSAMGRRLSGRKRNVPVYTYAIPNEYMRPLFRPARKELIEKDVKERMDDAAKQIEIKWVAVMEVISIIPEKVHVVFHKV